MCAQVLAGHHVGSSPGPAASASCMWRSLCVGCESFQPAAALSYISSSTSVSVYTYWVAAGQGAAFTGDWLYC